MNALNTTGMSLTAPTADLLAAVMRVLPVAQTKTTLPILACVRLGGTGDRLNIEATDLEVTARTEVQNVKWSPEGGSLCVNARNLADSLKGLRAIEVTLREDGGWLTIKGGSSKARIPTYPASEWPQTPDEVDGAPIDPRAWAAALERVLPFVCKSEERPNLTGVFANVERGEVVATDGHRIGVVPLSLDDVDGEGVILPAKGLQAAVKLLSRAESASFGMEGSRVCFTADGDALWARCIDGVFPAYGKVMPPADRVCARIEVDSRELLDALRYVGMFASKQTRMITLAVDDGTMRIEATSAEKGECGRELGCKTDGSAVKVGASVNYLEDAIKAAGGERVTLGVVDTMSPIDVRPVEGEGVFVVMPMRL